MTASTAALPASHPLERRTPRPKERTRRTITSHAALVPVGGRAPKTGIAGSGWVWDPKAEKSVPCPTAKPDPFAYANAQTRKVGR